MVPVISLFCAGGFLEYVELPSAYALSVSLFIVTSKEKDLTLALTVVLSEPVPSLKVTVPLEK